LSAPISINVWLAGRSYRIRVEPAQEGAVRAAVKAADARITEMRTQYAGRDDQDFVAMVLLLYAAQGATAPASPQVEEALRNLVREMDAALE